MYGVPRSANHNGIGLYTEADMFETEPLAPMDLQYLDSNRQIRKAPRHVYGTRHAWAFMLPRPTLCHVGYTVEDDEPLLPRFYTDPWTRPLSMTCVQNTPPSMNAPSHPANPSATTTPYALDAQYTHLVTHERERLYAHTEGSPSPIMDRMPPLTPIHVDEAKLYRTTHKSSTIAYHLPSSTRQWQTRREENEDIWNSLW